MKENAKYSKDIQRIIAEFQSISPNVKIQKQPETALRKLLEFEKTYQLNTIDIFNRNIIEQTNIEESILEDWKQAFNNFSIHKGDFSKINSVKISTRKYINTNAIKNKEEANSYEFASSLFLETRSFIFKPYSG